MRPPPGIRVLQERAFAWLSLRCAGTRRPTKSTRPGICEFRAEPTRASLPLRVTSGSQGRDLRHVRRSRRQRGARALFTKWNPSGVAIRPAFGCAAWARVSQQSVSVAEPRTLGRRPCRPSRSRNDGAARPPRPRTPQTVSDTCAALIARLGFFLERRRTPLSNRAAHGLPVRPRHNGVPRFGPSRARDRGFGRAPAPAASP
jgi:hypothetical protein